jgi:hypothetical protein
MCKCMQHKAGVCIHTYCMISSQCTVFATLMYDFRINVAKCRQSPASTAQYVQDRIRIRQAHI